jgi:WD repeat-containing protein 61
LDLVSRFWAITYLISNLNGCRRDDDDEQDENVKKENNSPLELKYIFDGHSLGAVSVDISSDGRTAATSSLDCQIRFLDLENGCPVQRVTSKIDAGPLESWTIAYSPDATLIATGNYAGKIGIYDTQSGKLQTRLDTAGKFVLSVIFSPDGRRIASGSNDGMVKIFDVETEKLLHTLEGHALPVRSVAFVSDSDTVVTGSDDCHIKMYDIRREESPEMPISTFSGHGAWVLCVDPSPDGRYLASR